MTMLEGLACDVRHPHQRLIVMPNDGAEAVLGLIALAQRELLLKQFKLESPEVLQALDDAHARGVRVRVMLNPHTSGGVRWNDSAFERLQAAGVDVAWTSDRFPVTHEKSMVIDRKEVLISTFNLSNKYFTQTRDYGIVTFATEVVEQVIACFEADWERREFEPDLTTGLFWSNQYSRGQIAHLIDEAEDTLDIQHPKFVDAVILDRVIKARERGVKVRVLCGGKHGISDWDIYDTFSSLRIMRHAGVKIRRQKHLKLHAKLILVDGRYAQTGSMNLDRSAFDVRRELGVGSDAEDVLMRLKRIFEADWDEAHAYEAPDPLDPAAHDDGELIPDPEFVHE
jgi:phosphatidylserine/phosphatidylglycerophosphate/cardiolipin synthase-like enzyme